MTKWQIQQQDLINSQITELQALREDINSEKPKITTLDFNPFMGIRGNEMYKTVTGMDIHYSNDMGQTWTAGKVFTGIAGFKGFITKVGTHLLYSQTNRELYRSTDKGQTYTLVLSNVDRWYGANSIEQNYEKGTICFGEYETNDATRNIWRSTDDGATWTSVLTQVSPTDIRHFHTCQYNVHDKNWYATTGDHGSQVKWFKSIDDGLTWTDLMVEATQKYRALGLIFYGDGTIVWGTDSAYSEMGVWKTNVSDVTQNELLFGLDTSIFGIKNIGSSILISTQPEALQVDNSNPAIYLSNDMGKTWKKIYDAPRLSVEKTGFGVIYGMDLEGKFYVHITGLNKLKGFENGERAVVVKI